MSYAPSKMQYNLVEDLAEGSDEVQVFITGGLHLVGGTLSILEGDHTPVPPARPILSQDVASKDGQTGSVNSFNP